jgi:hypothetical protein
MSSKVANEAISRSYTSSNEDSQSKTLLPQGIPSQANKDEDYSSYKIIEML